MTAKCSSAAWPPTDRTRRGAYRDRTPHLGGRRDAQTVRLSPLSTDHPAGSRRASRCPETGGIIFGRYSDVPNALHVVGTCRLRRTASSPRRIRARHGGAEAMLQDLIEGSGGASTLGTWHNHLVPAGLRAGCQTAALLSISQYFPLLMLIHTPHGLRHFTAEAIVDAGQIGNLRHARGLNEKSARRLHHEGAARSGRSSPARRRLPSRRSSCPGEVRLDAPHRRHRALTVCSRFRRRRWRRGGDRADHRREDGRIADNGDTRHRDDTYETLPRPAFTSSSRRN